MFGIVAGKEMHSSHNVYHDTKETFFAASIKILIHGVLFN